MDNLKRLLNAKSLSTADRAAIDNAIAADIEAAKRVLLGDQKLYHHFIDPVTGLSWQTVTNRIVGKANEEKSVDDAVDFITEQIIMADDWNVRSQQIMTGITAANRMPGENEVLGNNIGFLLFAQATVLALIKLRQVDMLMKCHQMVKTLLTTIHHFVKHHEELATSVGRANPGSEDASMLAISSTAIDIDRRLAGRLSDVVAKPDDVGREFAVRLIECGWRVPSGFFSKGSVRGLSWLCTGRAALFDIIWNSTIMCVDDRNADSANAARRALIVGLISSRQVAWVQDRKALLTAFIDSMTDDQEKKLQSELEEIFHHSGEGSSPALDARIAYILYECGLSIQGFLNATQMKMLLDNFSHKMKMPDIHAMTYVKGDSVVSVSTGIVGGAAVATTTTTTTTAPSSTAQEDVIKLSDVMKLLDMIGKSKSSLST